MHAHRIAYADDHEGMRKRIVGLMNTTGLALGLSLQVVEFENGADLVAAVIAPDAAHCLVLTDYSMPRRDNGPEMSGLEVIQQIRRVKMETPIYLISTHSREQLANTAIRAGATGYIMKGSDTDEDLKAVFERHLISA